MGGGMTLFDYGTRPVADRARGAARKAKVGTIVEDRGDPGIYEEERHHRVEMFRKVMESVSPVTTWDPLAGIENEQIERAKWLAARGVSPRTRNSRRASTS